MTFGRLTAIGYALAATCVVTLGADYVPVDWDKVDGSMPSYWTVCGRGDGWECAASRTFTKGVSGMPGN